MPGLLESSELVSNSKAVSQCSGWSPICSTAYFPDLWGANRRWVSSLKSSNLGEKANVPWGWNTDGGEVVLSCLGSECQLRPMSFKYQAFTCIYRLVLFTGITWWKNRVRQNLWSRCGRQSTTEQYESTVYMWAIEALTIPVHLWAQEHIQQNPARLWSIGKTLGGSMHRRINWQFPRLELLPLPLLLFLSPKDLQSYSPKSWGFFTKGQKVRFAPLCGKGTERKSVK